MPTEVLFGSTILMLEKLLDFQSERHSILSTNVANIDTPGYKGYDLRFSDELKKAVEKIEEKIKQHNGECEFHRKLEE